jgi:hypothetical protein
MVAAGGVNGATGRIQEEAAAKIDAGLRAVLAK